MNTERLHIHRTPHYSPIWVCRSIPNRTVCFLYVLKRSIQTIFWYVGQCPYYSTPLKFSSRCLFNTPIEIQDPNRGPSPPQAHGVSGWGSAGWHHERQGQLLADAGRVSGKGCARSGEARRHRQINADAVLEENDRCICQSIYFTSTIHFVLPVNHVIRCFFMGLNYEGYWGGFVSRVLFRPLSLLWCTSGDQVIPALQYVFLSFII